MALAKQPMTIPLIGGLNQKADPRALQPPGLAAALDITFDQVGGVQTRYPFADLGTDILGGGAIANPRRLVANGDELLLFTKDSLYTWSGRDTAWVFRATHLAVKVAEETRFARAMDQVDCDRAELGNVVFYTWTGSDIVSSQVYLAARDKTTGSVLLPPTIVDPGVAGTRPRVLALDTRVLLVWSRSITAGLVGIAIDPANIAASIVAPTAICAQGLIKPYDLVKVPGVDAAILATAQNPATSYLVAKITSAMVVTTSAKARTCDGPIAVSADPTGVFVQVARCDGTDILGDRLSAALADTGSNDRPIGTAAGTINHLTLAHRSVADGAFYRAYCFWSSAESNDPLDSWTSKSNWIDTNGAVGVEANFVRLLAPASRAFDYGGRVYVWGVFAGTTLPSVAGYVSQLQNTFFLYRDDASLVSKACFDVAGGLPPTTMLPGIACIDGQSTFAWCATMRRAVPVGTNAANLGYAERAPRDVIFTFDSDEARRCARLGQTLYVTGGEILQYDGTGLYEVGFHVYPWFLGHGLTATGNMENGTYAYKATWKWPNAKGEVDRSTTATVATAAPNAGPPQGVDIAVNPLFTTRKIAEPPACEIWRTEANPTADAPFFLVSSPDPAVLAGANAYVTNDPTVFPLPVFHDELADSSIAIRQTNPENGTVLESLAPPGATLIAASNDRIFLAGIASNPNLVWYSKQRGDGEVAAFNDALVVELPAKGGAITALAFLNETLIVFTRTAIYALPGDGYDNTGGGSNYGPPRVISTDVGALNAEGVALLDAGLVFKSEKGWRLLNRGWSVEDLGLGVSDYDAETPLSVHVLEDKQEIRCLSSSRLLVFTYTEGVKQWSESTIADGLSACIWRGVYTYLSSSGAKTEQASHDATTYGIDIETGWIKFADLVGFARVYRLIILGVVKSTCSVRVRLAYNYDDTFIDDKTMIYGAGDVGAPLELQHGPKYQQCSAMKLRITVTPATTGESVNLTGLGLEVGLKPGLYRLLAAAQKQ